MKIYEQMAKLNLSESERDDIYKRAESLLQSFNKLEEVDTDGIVPLVTVLDIQNILREDVAKKTLTREELLSNAPEQHEGFFSVPKTLD